MVKIKTKLLIWWRLDPKKKRKRKSQGLTAEYPATSKIIPKIGWIRGYEDTRMRRRETLGLKLQELAGYADTWLCGYAIKLHETQNMKHISHFEP